MLTIRLQRMGKNKMATYRLIISEKTKDVQNRYLEILGTYNPHDKEKGLVLKEDKIKDWIKKGAQTSNTVYNLLLNKGLIQGKKRKSVYLSQKRKNKLAEKAKAKEPPAAAPATLPVVPVVEPVVMAAEEHNKDKENIAVAAALQEKPVPISNDAQTE